MTATIAVAHATTYYVSAVGSDANDGLSNTTPWQTIGKVNAAHFLAGQSLAFRGGDTFYGCPVFSATTNLQNSAANNIFLVYSYGSGAATIASNCPGVASGTGGPKSAAVTINSVSGFIWTGVNVSANGTATQYGILIESTTGNAVSSIKIKGSTISGFHIGNAATSDYSAEIGVFGFAMNGACGALSYVSILNNTLMGAQGPASPDDSGISGYGCATNNIPNISHARYQGNTVYNIGGRPTAPPGTSGNGIILNSVVNGLAQFNKVHDSGMNTTTCGGPGGIWDYNANAVTIQFNEVYGMTRAGGCDAAAFDIDNGVTNTTVQYNYSHDNKGAGFETTIGTTGAINAWGPNTIRYNISENDYGSATSSSGGSIQIAGGYVSPSVINVYNNTIFQTGSPTLIPACIAVIFSPNAGVAPFSGNVTNNVCSIGPNMYNSALFYDFNGSTAPLLNFKNNDLFSPNGSFQVYSYGSAGYSSFTAWAAVVPGHEKGTITADPLFSGQPPGGTCSWDPTGDIGPQPCPSVYQLSHASPARTIGADLTNSLLVGGRDYFGNPIPSAAGTGYSIGAGHPPH